MLSICPLLHVNYEGKLIPVQKVRTKKKVIEAIEKKMEELAENGLAYDGKCYISHSACQADAEAVASLVESRFPNLNGRVLINSIGTTIGSHTGPGNSGTVLLGRGKKIIKTDSLGCRCMQDFFSCQIFTEREKRIFQFFLQILHLQ